MNAKKPSFIGSVIKAIACTPNLKLDHTAYDSLVAQPTRDIRALGEQLEGDLPEKGKARDVLFQLRGILDAKGITSEEISDYLREIIELHQLQDVCSELLETAAAAVS